MGHSPTCVGQLCRKIWSQVISWVQLLDWLHMNEHSSQLQSAMTGQRSQVVQNMEKQLPMTSVSLGGCGHKISTTGRTESDRIHWDVNFLSCTYK